MSSGNVTYSDDCTHVSACCTYMSGTTCAATSESNVCGALTSQCVYDAMASFDTNTPGLFGRDGGSTGTTLYGNIFYNPLIVSKRSKFCTDSNNYLPEGSNNYCSSWWYDPADQASWGLNDNAVSEYCNFYKKDGNNLLGPGTGNANYMALTDEQKKKVDKICGCYTSKNACPGTTDPACAGNQSTSASAYDRQPAYHFQSQLNENCPPISVCMQNTSISPFAFVFGSAQEQSCTTVSGSPQQLVMYMEFIVIFFCALFLISIFYTTSVLKRVQS